MTEATAVFDDDAFQAAFAAPLAAWRGKRVCVGFSGGMDSVVLLHLLVQQRARLGLAALSAVHVHHGLQPAADAWPDFCAALCAQWQVDFVCERVKVLPQGLGLEAAARQARYAAFVRQAADIVALAHHADDQAETFLLAALRGGGVRALAVMPMVRPLDTAQAGELWRPLLPFARERLAAYAAANGLSWVEDPSNQDVSLLRNRIRHQLWPQVQAQVPQAAAHIQAAVALLQDEKQIVEEAAAADWAWVHQAGGFDCARWRSLTPPRRRQLLRLFAEHHGLGAPRRAALLDFDRVLAAGAVSGEWRLPQGRAVVYRNRLFARPNGWERQWLWLGDTPPSGSLKAAGEACGLLWQPARCGLSEQVLAAAGRIRAARADDVLPLAGGGHKPVYKYLQEYGVPPFMRKLWPVAADADDCCVAAVNLPLQTGSTVGYVPEASGLAAFMGIK